MGRAGGAGGDGAVAASVAAQAAQAAQASAMLGLPAVLREHDRQRNALHKQHETELVEMVAGMRPRLARLASQIEHGAVTAAVALQPEPPREAAEAMAAIHARHAKQREAERRRQEE